MLFDLHGSRDSPIREEGKKKRELMKAGVTQVKRAIDGFVKLRVREKRCGTNTVELGNYGIFNVFEQNIIALVL